MGDKLTICSSKLVYESLLWKLVRLEWLTYQQHLKRSRHPSNLGHGRNPSLQGRRDREQRPPACWQSVAGRKQNEKRLVLSTSKKESNIKRVLANTHSLRRTSAINTKRSLIFRIIFHSELGPLRTYGRHHKHQQTDVKTDTHVVKGSRLQEKIVCAWNWAFCIFLRGSYLILDLLSPQLF